MNILIDNNLIQEGDVIFLKNRLPSHVRYDEEDPTFRATITGKLGQSDAVKWEKDGKEYSVTALTQQIFKALHPENKGPSSLNGTEYWVNTAEKSLRDFEGDWLMNILLKINEIYMTFTVNHKAISS